MSSDSPLAAALAQSIRQEILDGRLPEGRLLPAERDLSAKLGASRAMVRKAVAILASQGWLQVQPHCRPVVANGRRSVPATKMDHVSVWLWPYVDDYTVSAIFKGIQVGLRDTDLRIMVATAAHGHWNDILASEDRFLRGVASDTACAGAIVWLLGGDTALPALVEARSHKIPLVFIDRKPPVAFESDFVGTENVSSGRGAVEHLIGLGHTRIGCVTNIDDVSSVSERVFGYRRALEESGLCYTERWVYRHDPRSGETDTSAMDRLVDGLLGDPDRPSALFVVNDTTAFLLTERLELRGIRVPKDLSVVGFDGLLRWVPGGGRLTTADQDFHRMGELAADLLCERIRTGEPRTYRHVLLDAPIRVQGSTGPPSRNDDPGRQADITLETKS